MALKNVLLTGSGGFIGRNLLQLLDKPALLKQYRFTLLSCRPIDGWNTIVDRRNNGQFNFTARDVREAGIGDLHAVIHLGAFTPKSGSEANDVIASTSNIFNTQHLIKTLPVPRKFIFASTIDVYGRQEGPCQEDIAPNPTSLYGLSKFYCERMLTAWSGNLRDFTVDLSILRIGHIYGPGEQAYNKFIPATIARLKRGEAPLVATTGEEKRSFLYVDDCCQMIIQVLEDDKPPGCLNLASAQITTIGEVADILVKIAHNNGQALAIPHAVRGQQAGQDVIAEVSRLMKRYPNRELELLAGLRAEYAALPSN